MHEITENEVLLRKSEEFQKIISQQKEIITQLRDEREELTNSINKFKTLSDELNNSLNNIYKSNGWKFLSKYYRIRDTLKIASVIKKKPANLKESLNTEESNKVSIIIPVYNNAQFLKKCIQSALDQTYENLEVIALDDCSTQTDVEKILNSFKDHKRFRYYKNEFNCGISKTMNNAIIKAQGEWIAFLDCDDWLDLNAIEKMMNCLNRKPGALYAYSDRYNDIEMDRTQVIESFRVRPTENYLNELLIGMYTSHLKVIHQSVFLKIGLHESRFDGAQDYDIALKTAFHFGDAFAYLPEPVYHHRIHNKQTTIESANKIEEIVRTIKEETKKKIAIRNGLSNKFVSFVILSFEKKEMTAQCIESIKRTVKVPHEIIVFDNSSSEDTVSYLKDNIEHIEGVSIYYSEVNLGCPGGRRKATKLAKGDYIINLDNDIIVTDEWFEELIVRAESSTNVGAVCCKTVFPDGKVQFNGGRYVIDNEFITFILTDTEKNEKDISTSEWHECDWVPGGATLFKREVVEQIEYSEGYINAFEDNDVALQISRLGYKMLNCPSAKVYHYHIMQNSEQINKEKNYMRVRYNNDGFVNSMLNFYERNQLIINDGFVHRLMGVEGKEQDQIKHKINELTKQYSETLSPERTLDRG